MPLQIIQSQLRDRISVSRKMPVRKIDLVRRADIALPEGPVKSITRLPADRVKRFVGNARLMRRAPAAGPGPTTNRARQALTRSPRRGIAAVNEFFDDVAGAREILYRDDGAFVPGEQLRELRVAGWVGMGGGSALRGVRGKWAWAAADEQQLVEQIVKEVAVGMEGGQILVEETAMGLEASGGGEAWRGSSGMNGASGGSTTADNSLALAVNGKRCGECQCVYMNHGTTNLAVARSGGGL